MQARRLHHHPAWTAADLAADLAIAHDRLALMRVENLSVTASFDLSYADLDEQAKRLFRQLGLHPGGDIDAYAAAALAGMIFQQSSFRAGALTASLPTVTVAKPVVASLLGVLVLDETLDADGPELLALLAAAVVVVVSTIALARGEAATIAAGAGRDVVAVDAVP